MPCCVHTPAQQMIIPQHIVLATCCSACGVAQSQGHFIVAILFKFYSVTNAKSIENGCNILHTTPYVASSRQHGHMCAYAYACVNAGVRLTNTYSVYSHMFIALNGNEIFLRFTLKYKFQCILDAFLFSSPISFQVFD